VELIELLRNVEIFEGLTDKQLRKIAGIFEESVLHQDEVLFFQGEKADRLYLIKSGFVELIVDASSSSGERVIRNLGQEIYGLWTLRLGSTTANGPLRCGRLPKGQRLFRSRSRRLTNCVKKTPGSATVSLEILHQISRSGFGKILKRYRKGEEWPK